MQVAAASGHKVTMVDVSDAVLGKAKARIEKSLQVWAACVTACVRAAPL